MKKILIVFICFYSPQGMFAQQNLPVFEHVEPAFWWVGMKTPTVQILFYDRSIPLGEYSVTTQSPGIEIRKVTHVRNPHYLFITLEISSSAKAGRVPILFVDKKKAFTVDYELKNKSTDQNRIQGFSAADVIYLLMPDRFANGDPTNDSVTGMFQGAHRDLPLGRHGGDLKGISDHLDYITELGVTALWLNPVLENNQKRESYHGYAITDLYRVDRRFGTNEEYVSLIEKCHRQGIKVIQDMVANHIGNEHWIVNDPPDQDWIHQFPQFTRSNYRGAAISDPYRSDYDTRLMSNGWFDTTMPDVNQTNPLFATYLIQNSLWWIEYAGIDGIRMDTYPYPDKEFMAHWAESLTQEYPRFKMVGEVWVNSIPVTAYWQKGMINKDGYQSHLPSVTDFPFNSSVAAALTEPAGWDTGLTRLYNLLGQDFNYPSPNENLTFLDNHDMTRFFLMVGKSKDKFNMGITFLLTTRGIPQLYYGTELLMDGDGGFHPNVRKDFPGGWKEDKVNAFLPEGRIGDQADAYDFLKKLLNWRKDQPVIHQGKLTHYIPEDNIYVYFRHSDSQSIMVLMNGNTSEKELDTKRFAENVKTHTGATNVLTGEKLADIGRIKLPALTAVILELK